MVANPVKSTPTQRFPPPPFPPTLFPAAPILLTLLPPAPAPRVPAPLVAVLAFSAFFLLSAVALRSLPLAMASLRAASRASGRWARRSLISSRGAPTMPRCCFRVRRVRFLAASCLRGRVLVVARRDLVLGDRWGGDGGKWMRR